MQKTVYGCQSSLPACFYRPSEGRSLTQNLPAKKYGRELICKVMKLTVLFLTAAFLHVHATGVSQSITLSGKDMSLRKVFNAVEQQTGYVVFTSQKLLSGTSPVSIEANNVPLRDFLRSVLKDQSFDFRIEGENIILVPKVKNIIVDDGRDSNLRLLLPITGTIKDQDGKPLVGATVRVKGKNISGITDEKGAFSLLASEGDVLIISYIGFGTKEIKITGSSSLNISLVQEGTKMDTAEVIVNTGYQQLSKERSAGSFSKPNMNVVHDRSASMSILQRLEGLVPGLVINNAPNSQNPFLIRGLSTIGLLDGVGVSTGTNRNPLYVVDGIGLDDVSSINPQDVADVTVLKDATAASIWGARASNGVIVITTKRGSASQKLKAVYDGFINFQGKPDLDYISVMNSKDYIETVKELFNQAVVNSALQPWSEISGFTSLASSGVAPHDVILYNLDRGIITQVQADKSLDSLASINNVQQIKDLFYQNAATMNHTLSLSGGWGGYSIYGSFAYTGIKLPKPGEKSNTYKVNLRHDVTLSDKIKLYLITDLTNTLTSAQRYMDVNNKFYPYQLFRDADGNNLPVNYVGYLSDSTREDFQARSHIDLSYVPLDEANYGYTKSDAWMNRITGGTTIKLFKGLRFEGVYGYIKGDNKTTSYADAKSYMQRTELVEFTEAPDVNSVPVYYLPTTGGKFSINNATQRNWSVRDQLIYDNAWNGRLHQLTLLAGQEAQAQLTRTNSSTVRGYNEELQTFAPIDYYTLGSSGVIDPVMPNSLDQSLLPNDAFANSEIESRFNSYYANLAYTYNRKYSINGSWRIDKSNLFGLDKSAQNKPIWSVGGMWMLGDEDFLKPQTWLDKLGLRVTYGITGNSPAPGTAASFDILEAITGAYLPNSYTLSLATAGNTKLTWETTKTINLGIDISVLKNRLNATIDVYQKKTENLLGKMPINSFTGYSTIIGNFGTLQNKGVELSLSTLTLSARNFSWNTLLTLSYNKNEITKMNNPNAITTGAQQVGAQYVTGFPAFTVFAFPFAGLDNMGDPLIRLADKTITKNRDVSKPEDILFKGTYQPVWSGGFSNMFQYKNFGLTANIIYNLGHVMRRILNPWPSSGGVLHNNVDFAPGLTAGQIHTSFLDRWKTPGDEAITNIPSFEPNSSLNNTRRDLWYFTGGDINVVSASYIKLRDITLSYSLPKKIIDRINTDKITLRAQLSNIMLWKANKYDMDPEFLGNYPFAQGSFTIGVNVIF